MYKGVPTEIELCQYFFFLQSLLTLLYECRNLLKIDRNIYVHVRKIHGDIVIIKIIFKQWVIYLIIFEK